MPILAESFLLVSIGTRMKKHRFFISPEEFEKIHSNHDHTRVRVYPTILRQWRDVLRLKAGDPIILLNGLGDEFHAEIAGYTKDEATFSKGILKKNSNIPKVSVKLYSAMLKKDKFEWVLQKCTELGVSHFQPIISERTEKINLNFDRAEIIIREAAEQSEQGKLSVLSKTISLEEALEDCKVNLSENNSDTETIYFALHMDGEKFETIQEKISTEKSVAIFIGPEGGWNEKDLEFFKTYNVPLISLGTSVLRGETASVAISALLLL